MGACEILVRNLILGVGLVALAVLFSYVDALPSTERMIAKMSFATSATPPTTVAPAAPTAAPSTSLEAYKDLYAPSEVKCMITQSGRDGIGHQLEGKLSCIAMASFVGLDYIHKPFYTMQHVRDPAKMAAFFENFFGLSTQFRLLNSSTMKERRQVVPWVGKCWQNGWLRLVEKGNLTCKKDGQDLVSMDNCWDRMYCHGYMESGHWYKLVPHIHAAYFSSEKPDPQWTDGFAEQTWGPKVAVHIRRGDSGYQLKLSWYARQIESLRQRFRSEGKPPPLFRVQTDEEKVQNLIKAEPRLEASDIVLDGRSSSLELAIHRMIIADAFITSRSSLSMSMALIGNQSIVIMPNCYERTSLPHWTRAACDEK